MLRGGLCLPDEVVFTLLYKKKKSDSSSEQLLVHRGKSNTTLCLFTLLNLLIYPKSGIKKDGNNGEFIIKDS